MTMTTLWIRFPFSPSSSASPITLACTGTVSSSVSSSSSCASSVSHQKTMAIQQQNQPNDSKNVQTINDDHHDQNDKEQEEEDDTNMEGKGEETKIENNVGTKEVARTDRDQTQGNSFDNSCPSFYSASERCNKNEICALMESLGALGARSGYADEDPGQWYVSNNLESIQSQHMHCGNSIYSLLRLYRDNDFGCYSEDNLHLFQKAGEEKNKLGSRFPTSPYEDTSEMFSLWEGDWTVTLPLRFISGILKKLSTTPECVFFGLQENTSSKSKKGQYQGDTATKNQSASSASVSSTSSGLYRFYLCCQYENGASFNMYSLNQLCRVKKGNTLTNTDEGVEGLRGKLTCALQVSPSIFQRLLKQLEHNEICTHVSLMASVEKIGVFFDGAIPDVKKGSKYFMCTSSSTRTSSSSLSLITDDSDKKKEKKKKSQKANYMIVPLYGKYDRPNQKATEVTSTFPLESLYFCLCNLISVPYTDTGRPVSLFLGEQQPVEVRVPLGKKGTFCLFLAPRSND